MVNVFMTRSLRSRWFAIPVVAALVSISGCGGQLPSDPQPNLTAALEIRHALENAAGKKPAAAEAKTGGVELKRVEGWATLKGRFVVDGSPPSMAKINVDKDQAVCGAHELIDESVAVGPNRGLANVAFFVRTPKIPVHKQYDASAAEQVVMDNHDCRFEPHVQKARVGQTLLVKNSDPVAHNTNASGRNLSFNSLIPSMGSIDAKVAAPESTPVPVSCSIHPWMKGKLVVTSNPYCAISKKDGSFEIENLPAGELEFQVWQENAGWLPVTSAKLKPGSGLGRYIVSLEPNKPEDLGDITVTAAALSGK